MKSARGFTRGLSFLLVLWLVAGGAAYGWGRKGHRIVNRVAMETLPSGMPAFLRSRRAIQEVTYLAPEPDRWRVEEDLNSAQAAGHFIDLELADVVAPEGLPQHRFDFLRDLRETQLAHPRESERFTPEKVGLLPWQANEWFERLEIDMRNYRVRAAAGQKTFAVRRAILYDVGILGHYVADGSQPLHTTVNYDGWKQQNNPEGFSRQHGIHSQFETMFVNENITAGDVRALVPSQAKVLRRPFANFVAYLRVSHGRVAELYLLAKQGGFEGTGSSESRQFTARRLVAGAAMLRDMVYTAWVYSARAD